MFLQDFKSDIFCHADDNTPYVSHYNFDRILKNLENYSNSSFQGFKNQLMKANPDTCHLLVTTNDRVSIKLKTFYIKNSTVEKLLDIKFDTQLSFESHVSSLWKLHDLTRIVY